MKALIVFGVLLTASAAWAGEEWKDYGKGIRWEKSLEDAKLRAVNEGKPILLHQLVGDLDKEGC